MNKTIRICCVAAISAGALPSALAQSPAPAAAAASAPAAALGEYRSALEGYQPFRDEKVRPWKDSNDTVGRIGGWRAYAKEVQEAKPPDAKPADPHSGHTKP